MSEMMVMKNWAGLEIGSEREKRLLDAAIIAWAAMPEDQGNPGPRHELHKAIKAYEVAEVSDAAMSVMAQLPAPLTSTNNAETIDP
jgi:hypothetical protein